MPHFAKEPDAEDYGPLLRGGQDPAPRRGRRAARYVAGFMGALMLFGAGLFGTLLWLGGGVARIEVAGLTGTSDSQANSDLAEPVLQEVTGVTNVLAVGSDSREGLTEEQLLQLGTQDDGGPNLTDTIILVQLDAENDRAQVLSFPRDLLVTHCDGSRGRINAAFNLGDELEGRTGPECVVQTVRRLTGISIDHYVQVNFEGFIEAVDAVGGVSFHIDEPLRDNHAGLDLEPGCVTFDGAKALGFVRARHLDSDFGRIARQQRFMRELLGRATSLETLTNPARITGLVRAVSASLTTDEQLSTLEMAQLAYTFRELTNEELETYTVPGYDAEWNGASVLMLEEDQAAQLFAQFRQSTAPSIAAGSESASESAVSSDSDSLPDSGKVAGPGEKTSIGQDSGVAVGAAEPAAGAGTLAPEADPSPDPTYAGSKISDVDCS